MKEKRNYLKDEIIYFFDRNKNVIRGKLDYENETLIKLKIVNDNLHCGAPASSAKLADDQGKQAIADLNIEQLQSFSKNGKVNWSLITKA